MDKKKENQSTCSCVPDCSCVANTTSQCVGSSPIRQASIVTAAIAVGAAALIGGLLGSILGVESRSAGSVNEADMKAIIASELDRHYMNMAPVDPIMEPPIDMNESPSDDYIFFEESPGMQEELDNQEMVTQSFGEYLVREGVTVEEAIDISLEEGFDVRIAVEDGVAQPLSKDYSPTRVNLIVENGIVIGVQVG